MSRFVHTFTANVVTDDQGDDVVATALSPFANEYEISATNFHRMGSVLWVQVKFRAVAETAEQKANVIRVARLAAEALSHQWPTDGVTIDGERPKYHHRKGA